MNERKDFFVSEFEFLIKSSDRISGTESNANFALNQPILGIDGIKMKYFQTYNVVPNITILNNIFTLGASIAGNRFFQFPPGHYVSGTGTVTYGAAIADLATFTNDIRYVILRQAGPAYLSSVTLDPATGLLTIAFDPVAGIGVYNPTLTSTATWTGLVGPGTAAATITGVTFLNLALTQSIAIECPEFHNKGFVDTYPIPSNSFLDVVPVYADFSDTLYYEPTNPIQLDIRNAGRPLGTFNIRFIDPVTRMETPMTIWQLGVTFRATTLIPY
jgi:hypothetical protein